MKRILIAFFASFAFLSVTSLTGCSTLADAKAAKGTGILRVYDQPYDVVWDAVLASVQATKLSIVSQSRTDGMILAKGHISAFSYGENVAIYVESVNGQVKTRVEIINKRVLATNVTAPNWEARLSKAIDARLNKMN